MIHLIETADRVFESRVEPDTPGYCRRTLTLRQLSGPPLSEEEWRQAMTAVVAEMASRGIDVHQWRMREE